MGHGFHGYVSHNQRVKLFTYTHVFARGFLMTSLERNFSWQPWQVSPLVTAFWSRGCLAASSLLW